MPNETISGINTWGPEDFKVALQTHAAEAACIPRYRDLPTQITVDSETSGRIVDVNETEAAKTGIENQYTRSIKPSTIQNRDSFTAYSVGTENFVARPELEEGHRAVFDVHNHPSDSPYPPSAPDVSWLLTPDTNHYAPVASAVNCGTNGTYLLLKTLDTEEFMEGHVPTDRAAFVNKMNKTIDDRRAAVISDGILGGKIDPRTHSYEDHIGYDAKIQLEVLKEECREKGVGLYYAPADRINREGITFEVLE